jgi:hypothetical protein
MNPLEDQLRAALRRREPSLEFTRSVLQRTGEPRIRLSSRRIWWFAATAAACSLAVTTVAYRQQRGRSARDQVLLAVGIASAEVRKAQDKVLRIKER